MKTVFFVILLAWTPNNTMIKGSGVQAFYTLKECHDTSLAFSRKYSTVIKLCKEISEKNYNIIAKYPVTFNNNSKPWAEVDEQIDEVFKLRKALKEIGKWHRGKTKDSQRVRAIIKRAMK